MDISGSYLTTLFSGLLGSDTSIIQTLYGQGPGGRAPSGESVASALRSAELNEARDVGLTAKQPAVKLATDRFAAAVRGATSVSQVLKNPAVMEVLLTANGLGKQISATALAQQALTSDLSDPTSLANRLTDTRWKNVAGTYDFANQGLAVIQQPAVIDKLIGAYAEVKWRESLDARTPGLSNALTFRSEAASITHVDQILGDPVMRNVVTTALGLPLEIAFQSLTAQENAITSRVDITKFKDPKFVETFIQRYLLNSAANAAAKASASEGTDLTSLAIQANGLVV